jgi:hypothetical protein
MIYLLGLIVLLIVGAVSKEKTLTHRIAVALDILTLSVTWKQYDVTISSWCGMEIRKGSAGNKFGRALGWCLNHLQANHCELAILADLERAQSAATYLTLVSVRHIPGQ